ncbi:MAG: ArsR/SmtB family transcription factor [Streptosporangiales bacterium]
MTTAVTRDRYGDADVATVAALFAEPARARVLQVLADGRALAASVLASEAGVSAPAASAHLAKLRDAGLVSVERSGRHRFYCLAGSEVAAVLESLASIAPPRQVRSLTQGTRAEALRRARTCYDHLAGRLGVAVTAALLDQDALVRVDGVPTGERRDGDRISAPLAEHPYELGRAAAPVLGSLGVDVGSLRQPKRRTRPLLRFCLDWSEQRHHLAGGLGAALLTALLDAGWVRRRPRQRAVHLTDEGVSGLRATLGVQLPS